MYLAKLEIQGFKTFAKKTVLKFPPQQNSHKTLTVIVGPNGSGKSNTADAVRWCLGEQSMKLLRGKKTEDIIFSGSKSKSKSGFAEVTMVINNEDNAMHIDYSEVTITRRVYRDGTSEYLLNKKPVRLADIQILLAEAGIGQRSYSVIGQGMIDHVLTSSPEERKIFFDDATGVRSFQIKRHQSMLKLKKASGNLVEVELLLSEIKPRLKSLKRQINKLEKREEVEKELKEIQYSYFGTIWWNLNKQIVDTQEGLEEIKYQIKLKKTELEKGDAELLKMEQRENHSNPDNVRNTIQNKYKAIQQELNNARQKQFEAERNLELAKIKTQANWTPLPLHKIIQALDEILKTDKTNIDILLKLVTKLKNGLTRPSTDLKIDPKMTDALITAKKAIAEIENELKKAEEKLNKIDKIETGSKSHIFEFQRKLRKIQSEIHTRQNERNRIQIDVARIETKLENIEREMTEEINDFKNEIKNNKPAIFAKNTDSLRSQILNLKHQLELIGGIDAEIVTEYKETEDRHNFLQTQVDDIKHAINKTEKVIDELDEQIHKQSESVFRNINKEFQKYFKILFGGGNCSLLQVKNAEGNERNDKDDNKITLDRAMEELAEERLEENSESIELILHRINKRQDNITGIEIQATPPGKRLKALNLLSGGERALTSIALLSAIMTTNPSPFVILDEVDAALDEANTIRFANILNELRKLTQFIVITHNRATMEQADLLYGVTINDDGISNLLSVNLKDIEKTETSRR